MIAVKNWIGVSRMTIQESIRVLKEYYFNKGLNEEVSDAIAMAIVELEGLVRRGERSE